MSGTWELLDFTPHPPPPKHKEKKGKNESLDGK
jgi:hypothetical protein